MSLLVIAGVVVAAIVVRLGGMLALRRGQATGTGGAAGDSKPAPAAAST